jgi:hypothetical protein
LAPAVLGFAAAAFLGFAAAAFLGAAAFLAGAAAGAAGAAAAAGLAAAGFLALGAAAFLTAGFFATFFAAGFFYQRQECLIGGCTAAGFFSAAGAFFANFREPECPGAEVKMPFSVPRLMAVLSWATSADHAKRGGGKDGRTGDCPWWGAST